MPFLVRSRKAAPSHRYKPPLNVIFSTPPLNRRFSPLPAGSSSCRSTRTTHSSSSFYSPSEASPIAKRMKSAEKEKEKFVVDENESAEFIREPEKESVVRNEEIVQDQWIQCGEQSILIQTALNTSIHDQNDGFEYFEEKKESEFFRMIDTPIDDESTIYGTGNNFDGPSVQQIQDERQEVTVETTIADNDDVDEDPPVQLSPYRFVDGTGIMIPPKRQPGYDLNVSLHRAAEQRRLLSRNRSSQFQTSFS